MDIACENRKLLLGKNVSLMGKKNNSILRNFQVNLNVSRYNGRASLKSHEYYTPRNKMTNIANGNS